MALTFTVSNSNVISAGNVKMSFGTIAFDSSYPTGGESFTPNDLRLKAVQMLIVEPANGYSFEVDYTNSKIKAYGVPTVTVTGGDASITALGLGDDTNAGALSKTAATNRTIPGETFGFSETEVSSTRNLSALTNVRFLAIGY